jgi:hypothetical protein
MLDGGAFVTKTGTIAANGSLTANPYSSTVANEFLVFVGADSEASIITWGVPTGSTTYTRDAHAGNASNIFNCVPCYGNSTNGAETASSALTGVTATSAYATAMGAFKLPGSAPVTQSPLGKQDLPNFPVRVISNAGWRNAGHSR